jgi:glycosylphosphatidylinositol transamidase (GPIT) subunit GPI8
MNVYNYWHVFIALVLSAVCYGALANDAAQEAQVRDFFAKNGGSSDSSHTNNWAVLVCASRYWFNYRVRSPP